MLLVFGCLDGAHLTTTEDAAMYTYGPIEKKPSESLERMHYDTTVFSPEGVRHLAAEVGASRRVVGTAMRLRGIKA
jgi:hypothetical protein